MGDGVAAVVTIVDVTKRRILVVDVGAKNSAAEVNKRATEARIAATPPPVMSMNVRELQKFKTQFSAQATLRHAWIHSLCQAPLC